MSLAAKRAGHVGEIAMIPFRPSAPRALLLAATTTLALALTSSLAATPAQAKWVGSWTAPPHAPLGTEGPFAAASYEDVTISQILRITEGGTTVRVRFTNRYGEAPLAIGQARRPLRQRSCRA